MKNGLRGDSIYDLLFTIYDLNEEFHIFAAVNNR